MSNKEDIVPLHTNDGRSPVSNPQNTSSLAQSVALNTPGICTYAFIYFASALNVFSVIFSVFNYSV